MCCIIFKPKNVPMPSLGTLYDISCINRDGFGFVSTRHHYKTLDFDNFLSHLQRVSDDEACIIHMRMATQGSICKANTHPFECDGVYFAHNGVLPYYPNNDMTDSEFVFRKKIMPFIRKYGFHSEEADRAITRVIGPSRFAMMYKGDVLLFGDYTEIGGCYYSNTRWLRISAQTVNRALFM